MLTKVPFEMSFITARGLASTLNISCDQNGVIKTMDLLYADRHTETFIAMPSFTLKFIKHGFVYEIQQMRLYDDGTASDLHIRCCSHASDWPIMIIYPNGEKTVAKVDSSWIFLGKYWECSNLNQMLAAAFHSVIIDTDGNLLNNLAIPLPGDKPNVHSNTPGMLILADSTYEECVVATAMNCHNGCTTSGNVVLPYFIDGSHSHYYCNFCGDSCESDMRLDAVT